ncbi:MAG: DUF1080 domain-containing protein [Acidimicrobiia bacterium]|nr:DUF1080 domain-containing protein [Acidimicrobiia bacterium]
MTRTFLMCAVFAACALAQEWKQLFNGKNLDGWEVKGDGLWHVLPDGVLFAHPASGPRNPFGEAWPATITGKQYMDWRQSRNDSIRVKLNGHEVASHPGDPNRPKTGPIGLQLHDRFSVFHFRNIRIREFRRSP